MRYLLVASLIVSSNAWGQVEFPKRARWTDQVLN